MWLEFTSRSSVKVHLEESLSPFCRSFSQNRRRLLLLESKLTKKLKMSSTIKKSPLNLYKKGITEELNMETSLMGPPLFD